MGQQLDLMTPKCELEDFDMKRYSEIVEFKTSHYSFYLPVQLGMVLAGIQDAELYRQAINYRTGTDQKNPYWLPKEVNLGSGQISNYSGLGLS